MSFECVFVVVVFFFILSKQLCSDIYVLTAFIRLLFISGNHVAPLRTGEDPKKVQNVRSHVQILSRVLLCG